MIRALIFFLLGMAAMTLLLGSTDFVADDSPRFVRNVSFFIIVMSGVLAVAIEQKLPGAVDLKTLHENKSEPRQHPGPKSDLKPSTGPTEFGRARRSPRVAPSAPEAHNPFAVPLDPPSLALLPKHRAAITASRRQAVVLRRLLPPDMPTTATSFLGGAPFAPVDFRWPAFATEDGSSRAMSFIGQIDCDEIAPEARLGLLPDNGVLYIFAELDWGRYWKCAVLYHDGDTTTFADITPPSSLPHLYDSMAAWKWPRNEEDWPRLLPKFPVEPLSIVLPETHDIETEGEEHKTWPGTAGNALDDRLKEYAEADGSEVEYPKPYDDEGKPRRPYATYPHDWHAIRIAVDYFLNKRDRSYNKFDLSRFVKAGRMTQEEADKRIATFGSQLDQWSARASEHFDSSLSDEDREAFWSLLHDYSDLVRYEIGNPAQAAIRYSLGRGYADRVPADAVDLVRSHHARALKRGTPKMLCPPTCPQDEAYNRADEWILLFETSADDSIAHFLGEGVLQFWIRPGDLEARNFDAVEITGEAY